MSRAISCALAALLLASCATPPNAAPPSAERPVSHPKKLSRVLARLESSDPSERIAASKELVALGENAAPAAAELVPLLGDEYWDVRRNVSKVVVAAGQDAVPHLRKALKQEDYHLRMGALMCLWEIGPGGSAATPEVAALAKSEQDDVAKLALRTLERMDPEALLTVADSLIARIDDPSDSRQALAVLRRTADLGEKGRPVLEPHARKLLDSKRREHVMLGIELLQKVKADVDASKYIARILTSDIEANGKWFCGNVKEQGKSGAWAVPHLVTIIQKAKDGWIAAEACTVLESIGPPAAHTAIPDLLKALERPEPHLRRYVGRTLFTIKADPKAVLPALKKTKEATEDDRAQQWLTEAITKLEQRAAGNEPAPWKAR